MSNAQKFGEHIFTRTSIFKTKMSNQKQIHRSNHTKQFSNGDTNFRLFLESLSPDDFPKNKAAAQAAYKDFTSTAILPEFSNMKLTDISVDDIIETPKADRRPLLSGGEAHRLHTPTLDVKASAQKATLNSTIVEDKSVNRRISFAKATPDRDVPKSGEKATIQNAKNTTADANPASPGTVTPKPLRKQSPAQLLQTDEGQLYKAMTRKERDQYDYTNNNMSIQERERHERHNKLRVENPTPRKYPINVYCGGGKHCGHKVEYSVVPVTAYPTYCDRGTAKKAETATHRANHLCNFYDIICVHNRCIIPVEHLPAVAMHHCCSICRFSLHSGISSRYGLVFH